MRPPASKPPLPVVTPSEWSARGEAVVRAGDRRLLVFGGIPGERARVRVLHRGRHQDYGQHEGPAGDRHPRRRKPPCDRYLLCGSCPLMHLDPPGQEAAHLAFVRAAFAAEGLEHHVPEKVACVEGGQGDYRHVAKLAVGVSPRGHLRVGGLARNSRDVVPIPDCLVATPVLRQAMRVVAHHVIDLDIRPFDPAADRGLLRAVVLRQSRADDVVLATLVAGRSSSVLRRLADALLQGFSAIVGVHLHLNAEPGNAIYAAGDDDEEGDFGFRLLSGRPTIEESLDGLRLVLGPGDFYQANPAVAELIARDLLALLEPWQQRPVVDLYCGVGGFTLVLARRHGWAIGVERTPGAVVRARQNAALNRVAAEFLSGDVMEQLPEVARRTAGTGPVVVVDPARRGLDEEVLDGIEFLEPSALACVSCNPRALARDMGELVARGWQVEAVRAYDMFPQTAHVEMLALLRPPRSPSVSSRAPRRKMVR